MQWTIEELNGWEGLRPYVDTALFPLYMYRQDLSIPDNVKRMTYLSNLAVAIERRLTGRVLLFPLSYHVDGSGLTGLPDRFAFTFLLRFSGDDWRLVANEARGVVRTLTAGDEDLDSDLRFQVTADVFYEEILKTWQSHR